MTPTPFATMAELIGRYDVFLIDQFGVLRDNNGLYEGASQALKALKAANKVVVILSNSGKNGDGNARRLVDLGIERASFDHFVTSGDQWPMHSIERRREHGGAWDEQGLS